MANVEVEPVDRAYNTLPSGKEIGIFKVANTSLYRIAFKSGGELPKELDGMWTDPYKAQLAIRGYIERRKIEDRQAEQEKEEAQIKEEVKAVAATKAPSKSKE